MSNDRTVYIRCSCRDIAHLLTVEPITYDNIEPEAELMFSPDRHMPLRWRLRLAWKTVRGRFGESPYFVLLDRSQMLKLRNALDDIIWSDDHD